MYCLEGLPIWALKPVIEKRMSGRMSKEVGEHLSAKSKAEHLFCSYIYVTDNQILSLFCG